MTALEDDDCFIVEVTPPAKVVKPIPQAAPAAVPATNWMLDRQPMPMSDYHLHPPHLGGMGAWYAFGYPPYPVNPPPSYGNFEYLSPPGVPVCQPNSSDWRDRRTLAKNDNSRWNPAIVSAIGRVPPVQQSGHRTADVNSAGGERATTNSTGKNPPPPTKPTQAPTARSASTVADIAAELSVINLISDDEDEPFSPRENSSPEEFISFNFGISTSADLAPRSNIPSKSIVAKRNHHTSSAVIPRKLGRTGRRNARILEQIPILKGIAARACASGRSCWLYGKRLYGLEMKRLVAYNLAAVQLGQWQPRPLGPKQITKLYREAISTSKHLPMTESEREKFVMLYDVAKNNLSDMTRLAVDLRCKKAEAKATRKSYFPDQAKNGPVSDSSSRSSSSPSPSPERRSGRSRTPISSGARALAGRDRRNPSRSRRIRGRSFSSSSSEQDCRSRHSRRSRSRRRSASPYARSRSRRRSLSPDRYRYRRRSPSPARYGSRYPVTVTESRRYPSPPSREDSQPRTKAGLSSHLGLRLKYGRYFAESDEVSANPFRALRGKPRRQPTSARISPADIADFCLMYANTIAYYVDRIRATDSIMGSGAGGAAGSWRTPGTSQRLAKDDSVIGRAHPSPASLMPRSRDDTYLPSRSAPQQLYQSTHGTVTEFRLSGGQRLPNRAEICTFGTYLPNGRTIEVYCDGSYSKRLCGIGCYFPNGERPLICQPVEGTCSSDAETEAAYAALASIGDGINAILYIDCLSIVASLKEYTSNRLPRFSPAQERLAKLVFGRNGSTKWMWVKAHVGNPGNRQADKLAGFAPTVLAYEGDIDKQIEQLEHLLQTESLLHYRLRTIRVRTGSSDSAIRTPQKSSAPQLPAGQSSTSKPEAQASSSAAADNGDSSETASSLLIEKEDGTFEEILFDEEGKMVGIRASDSSFITVV
ncbi:hypothetical protein DFS34DRAFT_616449 [Phlyctochytrium arcticum]|nr:hypothetical protein DFS34DRAFT_616449 [Phlyctochytrium arcticum]